MSKYKKIEKMPRLQVDCNSFLLLKYLPETELKTLIEGISNHVEAVRIRDFDGIPEPPEGLSGLSMTAYETITESITDGAESYWAIRDRNEKNAQNRRKPEPEETKPAVENPLDLSGYGLTETEINNILPKLKAGKISDVPAYVEKVKKNRKASGKADYSFLERDYSVEMETPDEMVERLKRGVSVK